MATAAFISDAHSIKSRLCVYIEKVKPSQTILHHTGEMIAAARLCLFFPRLSFCLFGVFVCHLEECVWQQPNPSRFGEAVQAACDASGNPYVARRARGRSRQAVHTRIHKQSAHVQPP